MEVQGHLIWGDDHSSEVFATMCMLLQEVTQSDIEDLEEVVVTWNEEANDTPSS